MTPPRFGPIQGSRLLRAGKRRLMGSGRAGRNDGILLVQDGATLLGWVERPGASQVEVLVDGRSLWRGWPRLQVSDPDGRVHARGFRVDLPHPPHWDAPL